MKKYLLNLFNLPTSNNPERMDSVSRLAVAVAHYNHLQPEKDIVAYIENAIPHQFMFCKDSAGDKLVSIDVQFRDEYLRAGFIEVITQTDD